LFHILWIVYIYQSSFLVKNKYWNESCKVKIVKAVY